MKFQLALDKKGLTRDDLPKSQQKKIKEIEKLKTQIEKIESDVVDDSFKDEFDEIKLQFDQADEELVVYVNNFDLDKFKKQSAQLAEMRDRKKKLSESEAATEQPLTGTAETKVSGDIPMTSVTEQAPVQEAPIVPMPQPKAEVSEKIESLKQEAQVYPEQFLPDEPEAEEYEAEEEFEKVGDSKPRKLNVPLVIMGVGALLLTWGAVNFFKNKE